jgi:hypothetical protein
MDQGDVLLFGARWTDRALKFLELFYLALSLRELPLLAIQSGKSKMCLRRKRGIFLKFDYL